MYAPRIFLLQCFSLPLSSQLSPKQAPINRPGSKAFGLVPRNVVFDGVLILPPPPPNASSSPAASYLIHNEVSSFYKPMHSQHVSNGREGYALSKCLFLSLFFQLSNIPLFAHTSDPWFVACVHFRIERYCRRKRSFKTRMYAADEAYW